MSLKKFQDKDIIQNTMRAFPRVKFFIFDSVVYYNDEPALSGATAYYAKNVPPGHISLYEYNIDRILHHGIAAEPGNTSDPAKSIYPFITKQSQGAKFSTVSATSYSTDFVYGDVMTGSYPLSASISRIYWTEAGKRDNLYDEEKGTTLTDQGPPVNPKYYALRNRLNFYGTLSEHYNITASTIPTGYDSNGNLTYRVGWNKDNQAINLISIPSIFYGTTISPGSVSLKWFFTGSLIGELQDVKQNGELIQVYPVGSANSGSVAGVVMYNEGFVMLTGSWEMGDPAQNIGIVAGTTDKPRWIYFGAGAQDGIGVSSEGATYLSASFDMSFRGRTDTQVITMFTHAHKGKVNISNNPTYVKHGQPILRTTSSVVYEENPNRLIANVVSSSYHNHDADFKRQVYISRVAIYDKNKKLIGIATLANPILKNEEDDYSFKLKLDI
jgi:hypothetical protein